MTRWRIFRNGPTGCTKIVCDNLTKDMAQDLMTVLSKVKGSHYFCMEYEEARQHRPAGTKPHICYDQVGECWYCGTEGDTYWDVGDTPTEAYANWLNSRG